MLITGSGVRLALNGNRELLEQFCTYCRRLVHSKANVLKHSSITKMTYGGEYAKKLIGHFYGTAVVFLDRKQQKAKEILEAASA